MTPHLSVIHQLLEKAGEFAHARQEFVLGGTLKADHTMVTETDLAISAMAREMLAPYLSQPGHILLDEESIEAVGTPAEIFAQTEYQWVLDPIDGTVPYANGWDNYGPMLGLLHKGNPVAAGIIQPGKGLLLLADETGLYARQNGGPLQPFTPRNPPALGGQTLMQSSGMRAVTLYLREKGFAWTLSGLPAAEQFVTIAMGKVSAGFGAGTLRLWDFVPGAILAHFGGLSMCWLTSEKPVFPILPEFVDTGWKVALPHIIAPAHNLQPARAMVAEAMESTKDLRW